MLKKDNSFLSARKEYLKAAKGNIDFKTISKKELQLLRKKVIKKRKAESLKNWFFGLLISIPIIILGFYVSNEFIQYKNQDIYEENLQNQKIRQLLLEKESSEKLDLYYYLMESGDTWIEKKNWKNAIYQYKKAVKIFPEKFEANYRLALAYSYSCSFEGRDCETGRMLTNRILKYYSEDSGLQKLKTIFEK